MRLAYLSIIIFTGILIVMAKLISNQQDTQETSQNPQPIKNIPLKIKGSIPYWDQTRAFASFQENVEDFTYVNLFWYFLAKEGKIQKYDFAQENQQIISFAQSKNVKVFAVITNLPEQEGSTWDSKRVEEVLKNNSTQEKHIQDIVNQLESLNFDGVIIDYEEVHFSQRDKFSQFIKKLSESLHQKGKILAVALHPKTRTGSGNGKFQDWEELVKHVDHLNIMAYGQHWDQSQPGPIAGLSWVKQIIEYTKSLRVPLDKFYLGIPLYGYDWNKNDDQEATGLTFLDVQELLIENNLKEGWDEKAKSPYLKYAVDGDEHEVWFENANSVLEKINLAKEAGFQGISFWRLGGEDPKIWEIVK